MFLLCLNTAVHALPILLIAVLKFICPVRGWQLLCSRLLNLLCSSWIGCNSLWLFLSQRSPWVVDIRASLSPENWALVTCNHQSWADIFIVQRLLNHRVPQMKFFLKQELIWVPVIGLVWWALDFPFMKRHGKQYLKKHPERKGKDFETTRKACEKYRDQPVAIFNFMEGTRFTSEKHRRQNSPYRHLLKPRPGGTGYVLSAMGEQLPDLLDITIHYPQGVPGFWDFLSGVRSEAQVIIDTRVIPEDLRGGDYAGDSHFRTGVQKWVNEIWSDKDLLLDQLAANP